MFWKRKRRKKDTVQSELPPVDLRYKIVQSASGEMKTVHTSIKEQIELKKKYLVRNPNLTFIDDIQDNNSR